MNNRHVCVTLSTDKPADSFGKSELSTGNPQDISTAYPQKSSAPARFFLAGPAWLCNASPYRSRAQVQRRTQRPLEAGAEQDGTLCNVLFCKGLWEVGWKGCVFGHRLERQQTMGWSGSCRTLGFGMAAAGLRASRIWAAPSLGVGWNRKASGCAFGHDARTASEHLAPFPVAAQLSEKLPEMRDPAAIGNRVPQRQADALPRLCTCARSLTGRFAADQQHLASPTKCAIRCPIGHNRRDPSTAPPDLGYSAATPQFGRTAACSVSR